MNAIAGRAATRRWRHGERNKMTFVANRKTGAFAVLSAVCLSLGSAPPAFAQVAEDQTGPDAGIENIENVRAEWMTDKAVQLGVGLERSFNSSGPDAWDPMEHPNVFITTEGPGYGGLLSGVTLPGLAIYDADTREVVASAQYDTLSWGYTNVFEPHGLGVSPDGQWIYLPTGEGSFGTVGAGRLLVINARTLRLDKVLTTRGQPHHAKALTRPDGVKLAYAYGWAQPLFVMDPDNENRVVGGIDFNDMGIEGYLYFASPRGEEIIASGRIRQGNAREEMHDNVMIRINTKDWQMTDYIPVSDSTPVWVSFSADDHYAYFSGGHSSTVFKYDRLEDEVVSHARAGVEGPYGVHLAWDDQAIYTIGKGEGSHNRGKVVGLLNSDMMEQSDRPMDQVTTDCVRGDHGTIHPDPVANEMWITCNSSFEVVIFDLDLNEVTARLPTPNGGSTHSGSFVSYDGWDGEVVSDQNGLQGSALAMKRELLGLPPVEIEFEDSPPPATSH